MNLWDIRENEVFYIYKDGTTNTYQALTGTTNAEYKYIDVHWEKVNDLVGYTGDIYARLLWIEREDTSLKNSNKIIRASIRRLIKK